MNFPKTVVLCPDGAADAPLAELNGKTPLETAALPNLAALARAGYVGRTCHVPSGLPPGSDVCIMSLLGANPSACHTGRAPLEAPSIGVHLADDEIAVRCNFVTVQDGLLADFTAGHITTEEAGELIDALNADLAAPEVRFHRGVAYRHLLTLKTDVAAFRPETHPPHDIVGQTVADRLPDGGAAAERLRDLMKRAEAILAAHPVNRRRSASGKRPATHIWLWGCGPRPKLPSLGTVLGRPEAKGMVIGAVALIKSLGLYMGMEAPDIPGATGWLDTNYAGKWHAAKEALKRLDFVFIHVEAPDECGHQGDVRGKIKSLEEIDRRIVGPLRELAAALDGQLRILVCPDHPTPCTLKTHVCDPVPFLAWGPGVPAAGRIFTEKSAAEAPVLLPGHDLLRAVVQGSGLIYAPRGATGR
jgi:2,3-bisphosphoglycerate-independent phosphoglycerate mutase